MIKLYSPQNEVELAFLKGTFDTEGISYFVRNDNFGSMMVGPTIQMFNAKCILVDERDFDRAKELLNDFLEQTSVDIRGSSYSVFDKIRLVIETVLFGWIMPGRSRRQKKREDAA